MWRVVAGLLASGVIASACECIPPSVGTAKRQSDVVFRGAVTEIHDYKVTLRVIRVWKGKPGVTFQMSALEEPVMHFCVGMWSSVKIGDDVLVYAHRVNNGTYWTRPCSRTRIAKGNEDLKQLGAGWPPK